MLRYPFSHWHLLISCTCRRKTSERRLYGYNICVNRRTTSANGDVGATHSPTSCSKTSESVMQTALSVGHSSRLVTSGFCESYLTYFDDVTPLWVPSRRFGGATNFDFLAMVHRHQSINQCVNTVYNTLSVLHSNFIWTHQDNLDNNQTKVLVTSLFFQWM